MLGMHGTYEANMAMNQADLIVAIGARFDDRVTGRLDAFSPNSRKDPHRHRPVEREQERPRRPRDHRRRRPRAGGHGPRLEGAPASQARHRRLVAPHRRLARARLPRLRRRPAPRSCRSAPSARCTRRPRARSPIITTEVGQHQMWAAQHFGFEQPNKWLTSGGLGTMGYGLPAAIGAQLGNPNALVIDIAGEASIQMNIQELATATPVPAAGQGLHPQQRIYGHGPPVAGADLFERAMPRATRTACPTSSSSPRPMAGRASASRRATSSTTASPRCSTHDGPVMVDCRVAKLANCFPMIPSAAPRTPT